MECSFVKVNIQCMNSISVNVSPLLSFYQMFKVGVAAGKWLEAEFREVNPGMLSTRKNVVALSSAVQFFQLFMTENIRYIYR